MAINKERAEMPLLCACTCIRRDVSAEQLLGPPVVPGGFCFTMSQLVEDSSAVIEDSLNTGSCMLSKELLVDPAG